MANKKEERIEMLLLEEYKGIVQQIIHWNSHFWAKSQFFLVIESAFVGGAAGLLQKYFFGETCMTWSVLCSFAAIVLLNVYLCFVWFRTNRRNQEFLELRFKRAKMIEESLGTLHLFQDHDDEDLLPKKHRSGGWERHLATVFGAAWIIWLLCALSLKILP